ncbi:MAG: hypothetical protein DWI21_07655 [Planctomycetota bacterium]|nr:MAG: hypothetical protein DWI21_07655 [Planctomycetota bacterium]
MAGSFAAGREHQSQGGDLVGVRELLQMVSSRCLRETPGFKVIAETINGRRPRFELFEVLDEIASSFERLLAAEPFRADTDVTHALIVPAEVRVLGHKKQRVVVVSLRLLGQLMLAAPRREGRLRLPSVFRLLASLDVFSAVSQRRFGRKGLLKRQPFSVDLHEPGLPMQLLIGVLGSDEFCHQSLPAV